MVVIADVGIYTSPKKTYSTMYANKNYLHTALCYLQNVANGIPFPQYLIDGVLVCIPYILCDTT